MASDIASFTAVTAALWRQREAMQRLVTALAGHGDVDHAVQDVQLGEILRAAETEELARLLGLPAASGLAAIAAASPEPWQSMLADHLCTLRGLYTEITGKAAATGRRFWQESLDELLS
jgi:hypothetical protein